MFVTDSAVLRYWNKLKSLTLDQFEKKEFQVTRDGEEIVEVGYVYDLQSPWQFQIRPLSEQDRKTFHDEFDWELATINTKTGDKARTKLGAELGNYLGHSPEDLMKVINDGFWRHDTRELLKLGVKFK